MHALKVLGNLQTQFSFTEITLSAQFLLQRKLCFIAVISFRVFLNSVDIVKHILPLRASAHIFVITCKVEWTLTLNYSILFNLFIFHLNFSQNLLIVLCKILCWNVATL